MSAPEPRAYLYKYSDPFTGKPVWRRDGDLWNGQRPSETIPLYDASAIAEAVAREREEIAMKLEEDAAVLPCDEDAAVMLSCAALVRANLSYEDADAAQEE